MSPPPGKILGVKHSPQIRARAARLVREGKSNPQVAKATKTSTATIKRWKKDPDFLSMMHGRGVLTLGPVQVRAAEDDVLEHVPCEQSWVWIGDGCVLGSLLVEGASHLRAVFVTTPERAQAVRNSLEPKLVPTPSGERTCVLAPAALSVVQDDPEALDLLTRICTLPPAEAFGAFLSVWRFRAQETKDVRLLGEHLWEAQETFIREIAEHPHVYALKARKLGQSTIACAYDGFVLRFRDEHARVHLFSRRERAALEVLEAVKFGLQRLPDWLRLPVSRSTAREFELDAGSNDRPFVEEVPRLLRERGLSIRALAREVGVTDGHLSRVI